MHNKILLRLIIRAMMVRAMRQKRTDLPHPFARWASPVTIRLGGEADAEAIARVAERDTRPVPPAPHLVAEREGAVEALISLRDGTIVADPFVRTAELVELLHCRARSAA